MLLIHEHAVHHLVVLLFGVETRLLLGLQLTEKLLNEILLLSIHAFHDSFGLLHVDEVGLLARGAVAHLVEQRIQFDGLLACLLVIADTRALGQVRGPEGGLGLLGFAWFERALQLLECLVQLTGGSAIVVPLTCYLRNFVVFLIQLQLHLHDEVLVLPYNVLRL